MCRPKGHGFGAVWCENGYRLYFDLESGMVFERPTGLYGRIYRFNSERVRKKNKHANSKWISVKKSFLLLLF